MKDKNLISSTLINYSATNSKPQPLTWEKTETWLAHLLKKANITLNGNQPWDPQIYNPEFYR